MPLIGAYSEEASLTAYIFKRDGSTWTQQAKLMAGNGAAYDYHRTSVSISGDYAIIGANNDDDSGAYSGSAYIFKRDGSTWTQQAKLIAGDTAAYDYFGISVSISGDFAIVGAYGDDDNGSYSGSAYIFQRNGSTWIKQTKLVASDTSIFNGFGWSVSISGDIAIIGTFVEDGVGNPIRSAYLFRREGSTWTELTKITASDESAYDYFGFAVAVSGDTAVIGSLWDEESGEGSGSAYIYNFSITTANIKSDAETIHVGESAMLTWSTENADSISIDLGIGAVSANGSLAVSPQETTTYTITATGSQGTSTGKVTVHVIDPSVPPTVTLSAAPDIITLGETFILNWNSINAESCMIEPGIGSVDLNGPMEISIGATTTYTITATGPAGAASESVTVIVNSPTVPPTVELSSNPETVPFGQSAILTWNSTNAYSCTIEPEIGRVGLNGSINVSPVATTTYTITAVGYAGTITGSTTVTVIPMPTVNFSANPSNITAGESATLTWNSANADSCVIEPGIGNVDLSGSLVVSPTEATTYTITATGPGGEASENVTVDVMPPVTLQIMSPVHMQSISRPDIMVEGTFSNYLGNETGVTVNGQVAMVFNDHFVANHVPLQEGENTITVIGTDSQGYSAMAEIAVYAQIAGDYISITADTESGVSPFETTLQIEGTFDFSQEPVITPNGPDTVDPLESLGNAQYRIGMTTPGIYYFTAEAIDDQSNTYTDTIAVVVLDQAQLDALLRAKWDAMKTALINGDIEGALNFHHGVSKEKYQSIYNFLGSNLSALVQQMQNIEMIFAKGDRAKYRVKRDHNIGGQTVTITYYIYFSTDGNGLWKVETY